MEKVVSYIWEYQGERVESTYYFDDETSRVIKRHSIDELGDEAESATMMLYGLRARYATGRKMFKANQHLLDFLNARLGD